MTTPTGRYDGATPNPTPVPEPELLEPDAAGRLAPVHAGRPRAGRGVVASFPTALAALLVTGAIAFGAAGGFGLVSGSGRPGDTSPVTADNGDQGHGGDAGDAGDATGDEPTATPGDDGAADPSEQADPTPDADPTPGDDASPSADPTAAPVIELGLEVTTAPGKARLAWTACDVEAFAYWKVVRSRDAEVSWPKGEDDSLVMGSLDQGVQTAKDLEAPAGRAVSYRVFGIAGAEGARRIACASAAVRVEIPDATPTPAPDPTDQAQTQLGFSLTLKEGRPYLKWEGCTADAFDYYKVVASPDEQVRWPTGDNDSLRAAIGNRDETAFWDTDVPAGKTIYYRVFCVHAGDNGYTTLASTVVKAITTTGETTPPPDASVIGLEAGLTDGGAIRLSWDACRVDGFVYYKVVRSLSPNPSYMPWTDGTELIGVIGDPGVTGYEDTDIASGQTWYYRIQALGYWGGQKVVRCQSAVVAVTVP